MTESVDIETPEGERIDIEVEELSDYQRLLWAAKFPADLNEAERGEVTVTPELIDYLVELVESQTILTKELIKELDQPELERLFEATVSYAFGEDFDDDREKIEFSGPGYDLDEWR